MSCQNLHCSPLSQNIYYTKILNRFKYTEPQKQRTMFIFVIFLVVSDNFKISCIQINLPVYKDYVCGNFKWFDSHANLFGEKKGKKR